MKQGRKKSKQFYRKWHSRIGILMVLPLIFFTVSGVLLNHTEDFGLDKKRVRSEWVMERYGVSFEGEPIAYALESGGVAAEWQGQFIYNGRVVTGAEGLVGAVEIGSGICLVSKGCVYYISPSGELVEVLDDLVLPEGEIEKVGVTSDRLLVIVTEGGRWVFDNDLIEFEELGSDEENLGWSRRVVVDDEMKGAFKRAMIGEGVPLDRVILDVHSGNLFSLAGKVLVDVFGGLILIVSISGIIVYFRNKKRRALSK